MAHNIISGSENEEVADKFSVWITTGVPNENIVENHLNIALLNVFSYLNGRYRHIFIP